MQYAILYLDGKKNICYLISRGGNRNASIRSEKTSYNEIRPRKCGENHCQTKERHPGKNRSHRSRQYQRIYHGRYRREVKPGRTGQIAPQKPPEQILSPFRYRNTFKGFFMLYRPALRAQARVKLSIRQTTPRKGLGIIRKPVTKPGVKTPTAPTQHPPGVAPLGYIIRENPDVTPEKNHPYGNRFP